MHIEIKRNDEQFNLDNVSNEELFEGLKSGIIEAIRDVKYLENITESEIRLLDDSFRKSICGADGNLYPSILLSTRSIPKDYPIMATNVNFLVTPFDCKMILLRDGLYNSNPECLSVALEKFMMTRFPESDYLEKKDEFIRKTNIRNKIYDSMVFGDK